MSDAIPSQAVILAGGRGVRMMPLTATVPKPMIAVAERPFLTHLVEQLQAQGIRRIVILLGYLADRVVEHFGDGSAYGVKIEYVVSSPEDETGERLRKARSCLDPVFLLLYCDNYVPFSLNSHWVRWQSFYPAPLVLLTAYSNEDAFTRSNLRVEPDGRVSLYDKSRQTSGLLGVDIGYMIVDRAIIDMIPNTNASFETTVFPRLVTEGRLYAVMTRHRYYSLGSLERLSETEEFFSRRPAILLDRDGVLNVKMPRAEYVRKWDDWRWLDGAIQALTLFAQHGWKVILITNQPGINRNAMTRTDLDSIHKRMQKEIEAAGGYIAGIYVCPHGWDEGCDCRKPKPGMLFQAQRDHRLDLFRTPFVGDDERDREAAMAAGAPFIRVDSSTSLLDIARRLLNESERP